MWSCLWSLNDKLVSKFIWLCVICGGLDFILVDKLYFGIIVILRSPRITISWLLYLDIYWDSRWNWQHLDCIVWYSPWWMTWKYFAHLAIIVYFSRNQLDELFQLWLTNPSLASVCCSVRLESKFILQFGFQLETCNVSQQTENKVSCNGSWGNWGFFIGE